MNAAASQESPYHSDEGLLSKIKAGLTRKLSGNTEEYDKVGLKQKSEAGNIN